MIHQPVTHQAVGEPDLLPTLSKIMNDISDAHMLNCKRPALTCYVADPTERWISLQPPIKSKRSNLTLYNVHGTGKKKHRHVPPSRIWRDKDLLPALTMYKPRITQCLIVIQTHILPCPCHPMTCWLATAHWILGDTDLPSTSPIPSDDLSTMNLIVFLDSHTMSSVYTKKVISWQIWI